jgi:16S rRNA (uracil1498-N3)-methyltransferase
MTPRLLCELPATGGPVTVNAEQSHYLLKVLRLNPGDAVEVFDGRGLRFSAKLVATQGKLVSLLAEPGARHQPLRKHNIWLVQGLPSGDKMDWIIEKAVEIGVARFSPIECERSIVKLSGPRLVKKTAHWQAQIEAACMQSQRDDLMLLNDVTSSQAWFESPSRATFRFFLDPAAKLSLLEAVRVATGNTRDERALNEARPREALAGDATSAPMIIMAIGPESGFSDRERWLAERAGYVAVNLGTQVLRTETAGLVATAKLQAWLEMIQSQHSTNNL